MGDAGDGVDDGGHSAHNAGLFGELGKGGMVAETSPHRPPFCGHVGDRSNSRKQARDATTCDTVGNGSAEASDAEWRRSREARRCGRR